ncbi:heme/copper-type cytochrome/quinol oxidase subunit 4 [Neobacillus niacini]|nr:heme/copper-type cytochrome/quinol oxidase subunit 4 [Neobacillus niacini]
MSQLFPMKQVLGFVFSLLLTTVALAVYFLDMSFAAGMTILLVTAFIQAGPPVSCLYACRRNKG